MTRKTTATHVITALAIAAGVLASWAWTQPARADDSELNKAREEYKSAIAKANEALLEKHAKKEWASAKAKAGEAEAKAKANDSKAAIELYKQAARQAKDAIEMASYSELATGAATAAADARTKKNQEKAAPIVARLEKEKDLFVARDMLAQLEELIPTDSRMPGLRTQVKAMPLPKETVIHLGIQRTTPLELVLIPAGKFVMGSPDSEKNRSSDEGPQREVVISKPFYMSKYEVTQRQWNFAMNRRPDPDEDQDLPVVNITRTDAMSFCKAVSDASSKRTGRLPTEAEWEYACRAGSTTRFTFGESDADLEEHAWIGSNSEDQVRVGGKKKANAFGLFDMHGNVWEWVSDYYAESYPKDKLEDPTGPETGTNYVARGGSWRCRPQLCRSAYRFSLPPGFRGSDLGIRLVVTWDLE